MILYDLIRMKFALYVCVALLALVCSGNAEGEIT